MPDAITIEVKGLAELNKVLADAPRELRRLATSALYKSADRVEDRLFTYRQNYPPRPEGSTYVRTYKLQRSGKHEVDRSKLEARIYSDLDYADLVLGRDHMWENWWTIEDVAKELTSVIEGYFEEALDGVAKGIAR